MKKVKIKCIITDFVHNGEVPDNFDILSYNLLNTHVKMTVVEEKKYLLTAEQKESEDE